MNETTETMQAPKHLGPRPPAALYPAAPFGYEHIPIEEAFGTAHNPGPFGTESADSGMADADPGSICIACDLRRDIRNSPEWPWLMPLVATVAIIVFGLIMIHRSWYSYPASVLDGQPMAPGSIHSAKLEFITVARFWGKDGKDDVYYFYGHDHQVVALTIRGGGVPIASGLSGVLRVAVPIDAQWDDQSRYILQTWQPTVPVLYGTGIPSNSALQD